MIDTVERALNAFNIVKASVGAEGTSISLVEALSLKACALRGRIQTHRKMGAIYFAHLLDTSHQSMQIVFKRNITEDFEKIKLAVGDIIQVEGRLWVSQKGEPSVEVLTVQVVRQSLHPFPDKFHGLANDRGSRWLSAMTTPNNAPHSPRGVVLERARLLSSLRSFMASEGFLEVETPTLSRAASGAQARCFWTHHNDLNTDFALRIAPETFLKRYVGAGFDKVFEIGKVFRNEGTSSAHLQEFTVIEWYSAWDSYVDNFIRFKAFLEFYIPDDVVYQGTRLSFLYIPVRYYKDLFPSHLDPFQMDPKEADLYFKTHIRPNITQPMFVMDYPAAMCPLAKRKDTNPLVAEQWQLIVMGMEVVKCYSELTDPVLQRSVFEEQLQRKTKGDEEAVELEEDFLNCMEHGMPPMSGLGMGLDRLLSIICDTPHIKDIVFFS